MQKTKTSKAGMQRRPVFAPFTLDFTFKKAFANEQHKVLLLFLLNTFLKKVLKAKIVDVTIIQSVQLAQSKGGRGAVFDMHCEDASGARFVVEMQVAEQDHFIKRTFFYLCLAVANLAKKGKAESKGKKVPYDFNYPPVYTLSFLTYDLDFGKNCDEVVQYLGLSNRLHPEVQYDIMHMVYVRLTKFSKTEEECLTDIDRLLFSLKNADKLEERPRSFGKGVFDLLFEVSKISTFTKEELMQYEREMMAFSDRVHTLAFAEKKGFGKGFDKGQKKGFGEGVLKVAKNMLRKGLKPSAVARYTELECVDMFAKIRPLGYRKMLCIFLPSTHDPFRPAAHSIQSTG